MSATSGGSVSEGSEAGGSSQSTMSVSDSPSTSFQTNLAENVTKITLSEENSAGGYGADVTGSKINLSLDERQQKDGIVNVAFDFEEDGDLGGGSGGIGGGISVGFGSGGIVGSSVGSGNSRAIRGSVGGGSSGGIGGGSMSTISGTIGGGSSGAVGGSIGGGSSGAVGGSIGSGSSAAVGGSIGSGSTSAVSGSIGGGSMGAISGTVVGGSSGAIGGTAGGGGSNAIGASIVGGSSNAIGGSITGGSGSDEFKSMNGSEKKDKVPEAVNLELVNMVPYSNGNGTSYGVPVNGIPVKKDSEQVDMSSPYDEYFVPVNEHKKYMRGEKLYVTKDKRRPTSWRRCLSWVVACTVISVVLIVAILAGTGVILSEPNLVKEASVGRNFAGSNMKPSVTDKSSAPTAEKFMYVPRSIESEFVIDNLNFDPALKDVNSTAYQQFVGSMEDQLKMVLFNKETLDFGASDVALKIVNISRDPFKVNYRIGWNYKQGVSNPSEPIKMEDVKKRLVESLARNQGYIDKYHIDREAIKVNHVVDTCQMENGGCSHICYYNYGTQQFTCTCPTHLVLDSSGKNCVAWTGSSEDDAVPVPSHTAYPEMPYESTAGPVHEHDFGAHYEHGVHHYPENQNEPKSESESESTNRDHEPAAEPEPTAEPSPDHKDGSFYSKSEHNEDTHSFHDSPHEGDDYGGAPEPTAEPSSEDKYHSHVHSVLGSKESGAEPVPEPAPEPTAEPSSEDKYHSHVHSVLGSKEPGAEPVPEPAPEPTAEPSSEDKYHSHVHSVLGSKEPGPEPAPEPAPEPTAEPNSEGKDHIASWPEAKDHEPAAEPTPEPAARPEAEGNSEGRSHDHSDFSTYGLKEHEPAAEPTPEPLPEPTAQPSPEGKDHTSKDHTDHSLYGSKDDEPAPEPTPEPSPEPHPEDARESDSEERKNHDSAVHSLSEHEESAGEPTPEPTPEFISETKDNGHGHGHDHGLGQHQSIHGFKNEQTSESSAGEKESDNGDPSVHHSKNHELAAEPTPEPAPEPTAEPTPEPAPEPNPAEKNHDTAIHSVYNTNHKDEEPAAEPTPEPLPEPTAQPSPDEKDHADHSLYGLKDDEPAPEPTPEPSPEPHPEDARESDSEEGKNHGFVVNPVSAHEKTLVEPTAEPSPEVSSTDQDTLKNSKGHEASAETEPEPGADSKLPHVVKEEEEKSSEPAPEPTAKPSADNEMITHFNSGTGEQIGTTIRSIPAHESANSNSSVTDSQSVSPQGQITESKTEYPTESMQTGPPKEKPEHHAPHLEDILIRKPVQNTENLSETGHNSNPLDNVELGANGQPIIEEVIIDKSGRHHDNESGSVQVRESSEGPENATLDEHHTSVYRFFPTDQHQSSNTERGPVLFEPATDHPKIVEYSAVEYSTKGNKPEGDVQTQVNLEEKPTVVSSSRDPSQSSQSSQNLNTESVPIIQRNQDIPGTTTLRSEIQHESHTIPVTIEFLHPVEGKHEESRTEMPKIAEQSPDSALNSNNTGINEYPTNRTNDPSKVLSGEGSDQAKIPETTTMLHIAMPTSPPVLLPDNNRQTISGESMETENFKQSQAERGETTKSPEEISNNIKDELLDNEEFNTLIDPKESGPNESTRYPNKPVKTDKKKIKDYVKGDKNEQKGEATPKPPVTPAEFILQKHANGNENIFDLDYSLDNEHTTKHDGEVTIVDPHGIDVPGVSLKPHGINNHDISVLQTVAPDFRTEILLPNGAQEQETIKSDAKNKEGDFRADKDYSKFDKDYKYEKQKVSKKKDLKKKVGGKDGKNVELDDGRKYFTEISKEDSDVSSEEIPETTMTAFEKVTSEPGIGVKTAAEGTAQSGDVSEMRAELEQRKNEQYEPETPEQKTTGSQDNQQLHNAPLDKSGHLMIDEPIAKSTFGGSSETVYDGQKPGSVNFSEPEIKYKIKNSTEDDGVPGTVFDGMPHVSGPRLEINGGGQNASFVIYENTEPKVVSDGYLIPKVVNSTIHPTIIVNGENDNLQLGHTLRFGNSTFFKSGNASVMSILNGTLNHPDGHSFSYFPNGSAVNPTIVVRGQSGTLQGGHEIRFGNITYRTVLSPETHTNGFKNSNVYRIENGSLPGTVFDGHFNPKEGHYHMFTNSSGMYVYTNATNQPALVIRGQSNNFGNSTGYVVRNSTSSFSNGFVGPHSVIFRNSTVFAVGNAPEVQPHELTLNETIRFTHQMSPSFVSSGTAYKVNDYFGYISKCAAGQFQCLNGTSKRGSACISLSSKCDSVNDCSDGSDELGCIENGCPGNFQCSDSTCLKRNLVCNGILDCSDGSDEKNCESWKCEFDEFQCPSGRCIPVVWQCDNKPDCDNHTDEYNCQTSCGNDEYLCPEGWCIPLTYKCNGVKECSNGEDEQLCDCSHEEFKCQTGGCVSLNQVCNGLEDCPDRSDEWDCVKLEPESNLLKIRSASGNYEPVCADNWAAQYSDEVCASLGYFSSVPVENENSSLITTETSFYVLKNDTTADFNKKIIVNLRKSDGNCSSGKLVEISCQEFSCGSRSMTDSSSVEARLVGGMSATAGQWPSVALLYNVRNFHSCTANVLTPRWVLASYNCLKMGNKNLNEQDWKFFGGSTVFEAERENAETRKILSIIPHPQAKFNQFLFTNDLALVELDQSLQFTSNLGAVCLPEQEIQPRQICVTAGWGMNTPEDKAIRQQLQYLPVPTMNLTECNSTEHYSGFITDDKICAGYNSPQKSLCYNEEGAPLMCVNDRGEWELQGVLSYHSNCGRGSHPSIFSSIIPVSDWIKKTIGNSFERKVLAVTKR